MSHDRQPSSRAEERREELEENVAQLERTITYRRPVVQMEVTLSVDHGVGSIILLERGVLEDGTWGTLGGVELGGVELAEAIVEGLQKAVAALRARARDGE